MSAAPASIGVGEILSGQAILDGPTVQVQHGRISNHCGITVVLLDNQNHGQTKERQSVPDVLECLRTKDHIPQPPQKGILVKFVVPLWRETDCIM